MVTTRLWTAAIVGDNVVSQSNTRRALKGGESWPELHGMTVAAARDWLRLNDYLWVQVTTGGAESATVCGSTVGGQTTCCGYIYRNQKSNDPPTGVYLRTFGGSQSLVVDNDHALWIGLMNDEDACFGGDYHVPGASGGISGPWTVAPGTYSVTLELGGSSHAYTGHVLVADSGGILPTLGPYYIVQNVYVGGGHGGCQSFSLGFEVPVGYEEISVVHAGKMGGWRYQGYIYSGGCG